MLSDCCDSVSTLRSVSAEVTQAHLDPRETRCLGICQEAEERRAHSVRGPSGHEQAQAHRQRQHSGGTSDRAATNWTILKMVHRRGLWPLLLTAVVTAAAAGEEGHRYWRLTSPGFSKWAVVELRWRDPDGGEISTQSAGARAISSGEYRTWAGAAAGFDGSNVSCQAFLDKTHPHLCDRLRQTTYWLESKEETLDRWLGTDFGVPTDVADAEVMQFAHATYRTARAELEWSDDGDTWTHVLTGDLEEEWDVGEAEWEKVEPKFNHLDFL